MTSISITRSLADGFESFLAMTPTETTKSPETKPSTPIEGFILVKYPDLLMYIKSPKEALVAISVTFPLVIIEPLDKFEISVDVMPKIARAWASMDTLIKFMSPVLVILTGMPLGIVIPDTLVRESEIPELVKDP